MKDPSTLRAPVARLIQGASGQGGGLSPTPSGIDLSQRCPYVRDRFSAALIRFTKAMLIPAIVVEQVFR